MKACTTAGGAVFFIPEMPKRKKISLRKGGFNDNPKAKKSDSGSPKKSSDKK